MVQPLLFIETPRAGRHNHRFIVPDGYTGGDVALSKWADAARGHAQIQGPDFIAAGHFINFFGICDNRKPNIGISDSHT